MVRKAGLLFAGMAGLVICLGGAMAEETASIEHVMKTVAGKKGLCAKCAGAAKANNWTEAQKLAKELTACGAALGKNKCPTGDAASWERLTKKYHEQTQAIAKAADAKNATAFNAAVGTFTKSCKECHSAHK